MKDPFKKLGDVVQGKREVIRGKRLTKKRGNLTGVCAGIADYLEVDPILVRVGFIAASFFSFGASIVAYLGLSVFLPKDEAEKWGHNHYTYDEHEKFVEQQFLEEKQVIRRSDPLTGTALEVCPNCDTVAKPNSKFCHKCGTML